MSISEQNHVLPHLGADIRPTDPDPVLPARPVTPSLTALGVLSLAELFDRDPETALELAAANANDHWADVARRRQLAQSLIESIEGRTEPSGYLAAMQTAAAS